MDYKEGSQIQNLFPGFYGNESLECGQSQKQYSYSQIEWKDQISFFVKELTQQNYDVILQAFEYIYYCQYQIPCIFLIESNFFDILVLYFTKSVTDLCGISEIQSILLIPEKNKEIIENNNILLCLFIFTKLLQNDDMLQSSSLKDKFFYSILELCFNRNKFCQIRQLSFKDYSLCIEALNLINQLFKSSRIMQYYEERFEFTTYLYRQYIIAQVIEIKYYSLKLFLPWLKTSPGSKQTFELFYTQMKKTINHENTKVFSVQIIKNYYSEKRESKEYIFKENEVLMTSLFLEGIYTFIKTNTFKNDIMNLDIIADILNFAIYAILTNHELTIYYGLKIFNLYLKYENKSENHIILVLSKIRDKMPTLLNTSAEVCHEEMKMMKYLISILPGSEMIFFDEQFQYYFVQLLYDKNSSYSLLQHSFEWKKHLISFVGVMLNNLNLSLMPKFLNLINVADLISDIDEVDDEKVLNSIFCGIYRIMINDNNGKEILLDQGIEESINQFIDNQTFCNVAQALLNLIHADDTDELI
ncbi:hypothetical protein M9Y10_038129 [Tritrichomonas musculus]|uniref:SPIN90/Ldb17 leucine-rich domain-containing protein n=1 Tax=Tritrichomonas musculus TaxID=1915356 RepID=A0ABR2K7J3_9EUKA